MLYYLFTD
jgi:hypothetical protein